MLFKKDCTQIVYTTTRSELTSLRYGVELYLSKRATFSAIQIMYQLSIYFMTGKHFLSRREQLIKLNIPHNISKRSFNSFPNYSKPAASRLDMPCVHHCPLQCAAFLTLSPHPSLLF